MPRSGTNWGSQILASCPDVRMKFCPLFSYEFKNRLDERSTTEEWEQLFAEVYSTRSSYLDQDYLRRDGLVPTFENRAEQPTVLGIKSTRYHDLAGGLIGRWPSFRLIALVRHPVAAIHSWLTSGHEFPTEAEAREQWRSGMCRKGGPGEFWGYDDWKTTTREYLRLSEAYPEQVRLLAYDRLVRDPLSEVRALFRWAGLCFAGQTEDFLARSSSGGDRHGRSVFKSPSVAERWRAEAEPWLVQAIKDDLHDDPLGRFLQEPGGVLA